MLWISSTKCTMPGITLLTPYSTLGYISRSWSKVSFIFLSCSRIPKSRLVNCFMSSDRSFFSFLYSLVLVYKYQNRDHYICNFKCHRQKKYTMAFKANKPHGYQYTENRALTVQNLFVVSVRHCLTFLRPPRISSHARVNSQHLGEGVLTSRHLAAQLAAVDCEIYQSAKFAKNLFIFF